ncbi:DUF302 domain-containing protein [Lutibacter sp.]
MNYYFEKQTDYNFDTAVNRITQELKKEGFGILAEIDMQKTLKEKIDVDFSKYKILEACNPPFAHKSLQAENNIGILLPCNIVVREIPGDSVMVAVVNPVSAMEKLSNPKMDRIASEIQIRLKRSLDNL